ncbi:site-2 protease family protein [Streptobacillus ratti]|uniref:site-2 protease family protein n=1 Tax=Streptobacillus ratti TaxID=1720557 RepID=UPI000932DC2A|nr:site-2 protease family protein [Streptobacillus ratti]
MMGKREKLNLKIFLMILTIYLIACIYIKMDYRIQYLVAFIIVNTVRKSSKARMAFKSGDVTMMFEGKMGFNPINHIGIADMLILGTLILFNSPIIFGQGRNLDIKYRLFKDYRKGMLKVGFASIFSTLLVMVTTGILFKYHVNIFSLLNISRNSYLFLNLFTLFNYTYIVSASIVLFNLLPLPGFDMFDIVYSYADDDLRTILFNMNKYSFVFLILIIYIVLNTRIFSSIIYDLLRLIQ